MHSNCTDTVVTASSSYFHRRIDYWGENSQQFDFTRFKDGNYNSNVLMNFGKGNRQCLGMHLAYLEMKMLSLTLIRNDVKIEIDESTIKHEYYFLARVAYKAKLTR